MNDLIQQKNIEKQLAKLHGERQRLLSLPPEKALSEIIDSPQALPLVHSFPEQDLHILINEIGIHDALQILAMASNRQWEYMIDQEVWDKDKVSGIAVSKWIDLLIKADPARLTSWLTSEKVEFIELFLFKNIEIRKREHDEDPSTFGNDFFTFDDVYYIRFIDYPFEEKEEKEKEEKKRTILAHLLKLLAEQDHLIFQAMLNETQTVIPAEVEEEEYRLRNIRLAEKGFLPFEEAIGVYQPLKPKALSTVETKNVMRDSEGNTLLPVPDYSAGMLTEDNIFARSLMTMDIDELLMQLQAEFAALCNRLISADRKVIKGKDELRDIVDKACSYLSIGLQSLCKEDWPEPADTTPLLKKHTLADIFRTGYALPLELKWRAEKWRNNSWFEESGLPLSFWGEHMLGVLGGLLVKRPLYYDNYKTGVLFREFKKQSDIRETEEILDAIIELDRLLSLLDETPEASTNTVLTWKNHILTMWSKHSFSLPDTPGPISLDEFRRFYKIIFSKTKDADRYRIDISAKTSFLNWLTARSGLANSDITGKLGKTFENLFLEIESEYNDIAVQDLDPRYIHLFLVKTQD